LKIVSDIIIIYHFRWDIRESCNPIIKALGYNYKYDLSLPIPLYYDIVEETRNHLKDRPDAIVVNWGHVIDGNIHLNIITPGVFEEDADLKALLEPFIFEAVIHRGGSISAEHGLGQQKNKYLGKYAKDPQAVQMMKSLKHLFDPNGILNPGKFLPS
jgi:FAD/FMN-containing dehydrogenase